MTHDHPDGPSGAVGAAAPPAQSASSQPPEAPTPGPPPAGPLQDALRLARRAPQLLLLLAFGAVLLLQLGRLGLWDPWETRGATVARQAVAAGAWTTLDAPNVPLADRPPLTFWLQRSAVAALGTSELAVRLPGMLGGLAWLLCLAWIARRRWGAATAWLATLITLASAQMVLQTGLSLGNGLLLSAQAALVLLLLDLVVPRPPEHSHGPRERRVLPLLAAGAATVTWLTGGVAGLAVPAAIFGCWWLLLPADRRRAAAALGLALATALSLVPALLAPRGSLLAALGLGGPGLSTAPGVRDSTFEYLLFQLAYGTFPWSLLLPAALVHLGWSVRRGTAAAPPAAEACAPALARPSRHAHEAALLLLWLGIGYAGAALTIKLGGQPLLLVFPAALLAVALLVHARLERTVARRLFAVTLIALLWAGGQGMLRAPAAWLHGLVPDKSFVYPVGMRFPAWMRGVIYVWAATLLVHVLRPGAWLAASAGADPDPGQAPAPAWRRAVAALTRGLSWLEPRANVTLVAGVCAALLAVGASFHLVPRITYHLSQRGVLDSYRHWAGSQVPLYAHRVPAGSSGFYLADVPRLAGQRAFLDRMAMPEPAFAVVPLDRFATINNAFRGRAQRHLSVLDARSSKLLLVANHLPEGAEDRNPIQRLLLAAPPKPGHPVGATFDKGALELIGGDFSKPSVALGSSFDLTLYFRVRRPLTKRWKIFVHLETPRYRVDTGSTDHDPAGGEFPADTWRVGDIVVDRHRIRIPVFSPTGEYTLRAGLFSGDSRLSVDQAKLHDGSDRLLIGNLRVTAL